ncbi:uncharacterized protein BXZ73DRAFT_47478, partial [Epithele typhae]|uniref:uncharacterized protein n=1 Tax=Epithele typhae TaxID=378194 RepID=UPI0020074EC4
LGFADVPWPVVGRPAAPGEIETAGIEAFVLAGGLPGDRARDRVKGAMMRWHPDRFGRLWGRVREEERAEIEEGVGLVARCLSELMEKYAQ